MNRKIENFAAEKFRYELPRVIISPSSLEIKEGKEGLGRFTISYLDKEKFKNNKITGFISCSDYRFNFDKLEFEENEITIKYQFDSSTVFKSYEGKIYIITDCGEFELPYTVCYKKAEFSYESTVIKDLYQFTSFAKENFDNAVNLFYDDDFDRIMLNDNEEAKLLRHGLLKNRDKRRALEEFLCYLRTKDPVKLIVSQSSYNYHINTSIQDKIVIKKENWGYVKAEILVEGNFIRVDRKEIGSENFIFDNYELLVEVIPSLTSTLSSHGKIIIRTVLEDLEIDINLVKACKISTLNEKRKKNDCKKKLIEEYFNYRMGVSSLKNTTTTMKTICYALNEEDNLTKYVNIYLDIIAGNKLNAKGELLKLENDGISPEEKLIRLYFSSLLGEDKTREIKALSRIKGYENGLFFLLYLEEQYQDAENRLDYIRTLYNKGINSTFLLLETWLILSSEPNRLSVIDNFTIQAVNWALKYGFLEGDVARNFIALVAGLSSCSRLIIDILKRLYVISSDKNIIKVICQNLMKKGTLAQEDHEWIKKGIVSGVMLTGIYETYARNMQEFEENIPPSVFTYFLSGDVLNSTQKATLYSYLIKNKGTMLTTFNEYSEKIKSFAVEEIKKGEVSDNLVTVYNEVLRDKDVVEELAPYLSNVIFKEKYICKNKKLKTLTVYTKGIKKGSEFTIKDGIAFADVAGGITLAMVSDNDGNVYSADRFCSTERVINYKKFLRYDTGNSLISLITKVEDRLEDLDLMRTYQALIASEETTDIYKGFIRERLIAEFLDDDEALYKLLEEYDFKNGNLKVSEIALTKNIYPLSLSALRTIGTERADYNSTSRLIHSYIKDEDSERKLENLSVMLISAYKVMLGKKADKDILIFLRDNYKGRMIELYFIYRELRDKGLLTEDFVKRVLEQMLFSEEILIEAGRMFEYLEPTGTGILGEAFVLYIAYKWLLKDIRPSEYFIQKIAEQAFKTENHLLILSYLKLLSEQNTISKKEASFIKMWLERLVSEDIILPFYKEFADKLQLPAELENLKFVSFNSENDAQISISYRITSSDYTVEWMKNMYQGIFVKEFLTFADEEVQYYISLKEGNESHIVCSGKLDTGDDLLEEDSDISFFSQINMMYLCKGLSDEKTLKEYMKNYIVQRKMVKDLFNINKSALFTERLEGSPLNKTFG